MRRRIATATVAVAACAALLAPMAARAFDPVDEALNFSKITERERYVTLTPEFLSLLIPRTAEGFASTADRLASDPERMPTNVCGARAFECAGDVRFYDWEKDGHGLQRPVLFTSRSGATLSGTVWATRSGPAKRPAIVITTGSVQAPETLYWGQAATLAKHGYVVLTYDVQGQGLSDTRGETPDENEGVPSQAGEPFYDGTEDALDFLLSDPGHPYEPRPSCSTGTVHSAKQDRRVAEGFNAAYNPLHGLVDPTRIGIAGHSLGAAAVSYVGQEDPRVDATVAFDNLGSSDGKASAKFMSSAITCPNAPATRADVPVTKPAIGISNDYGIAPEPYTSDPDPQDKNGAFLSYRGAGVDSAEISIRGGCHEESAFIPGSFTGVYPIGCGTLRGHDLIAWYTTAWFDKYVKGDPDADRMLLTDRWQADSPEAAVDPKQDGNMFSFYLRSRYDVAKADDTGRAVCDDMRTGCADMGPDGLPATWSTVSEGLTPDGAGPSGAPGSGAAAPGSLTVRPRSHKNRCARRHGKKRRRCHKRKR